MAESLPLQKIETKQYTPWIQDLFKKRNVNLSKSLIEDVVARFENHPMYIQNFLFHLWEEPLTKRVSAETIDRIEKDLIEKRSLEHTVLWETPSINQKITGLKTRKWQWKRSLL